MAIEKTANASRTTLNGAIDNSTTSVVVTSASTFPSSGNFRIIIDSEIMLVTTVSSNTFTVTRAQESTAAASHVNGSNVIHILTSGGLNQIRADTISSGAVASLPTVGTSGRIYVATDDDYFFQDNGSTWSAFGPHMALTPPPAAWTGYTWTNQGGGTLTARTNGSSTFSCASQNGDNLRMFLKNYPGTPWTITAGCITSTYGQNNNNRCGLCIYDGTKVVDWSFYSNNAADGVAGPCFIAGKWTNVTTYSANYTLNTGYNILSTPLMSPMIFLRLQDTGSLRVFSISNDGLNYMTVLSQANNDFIASPTKLGFYVNSNNNAGSGTTMYMTVLHLVG